MPYAPTLTPRLTFDPVPRVEIVFPSIHPSAERATVYRIFADTVEPVSGAINVYAVGGFATFDPEAPFVGQMSYRAEMFDVAGVSLGITDLSSVVLNFDGTVVHQPLTPARAVLVRVLAATAASTVRPFDGELVRPQGRTRPVWIGNGRTGLTGVILELETDTLEADAAMSSVFGSYDDQQLPVICFRSSLPLGLPSPLFVAATTPTRTPLNSRIGWTNVKWDLSGDEAARPLPSLVAALLTYPDMEATYTTYAEAQAAYLTYLDAQSDFDLAGSA